MLVPIALLDLERERRPAVDAGEALRVLEGAPHVADVAQPHDPVALGLDRQVEHVLGGLEHARHLDREAALAGVERTRGDQPVVARRRPPASSSAREAVALDQQRVDDDLEQLLALAGDLDLEHVGKALDPVLEVARELRAACARARRPTSVTTSTGNSARLTSSTNGSSVSCRQLGLGDVDLLAHVGERLVDVDAGVELEGDRAVALAGVGPHLLDALDRPQLLLHRPHQQALGVLGRDALVRDRRRRRSAAGRPGSASFGMSRYDQPRRSEDQRERQQRPRASARSSLRSASS